MQNFDKLEDCFYLGQPLLNAGREHEAGDEDGDEEEKTVHDPRCRRVLAAGRQNIGQLEIHMDAKCVKDHRYKNFMYFVDKSLK